MLDLVKKQHYQHNKKLKSQFQLSSTFTKAKEGLQLFMKEASSSKSQMISVRDLIQMQ